MSMITDQVKRLREHYKSCDLAGAYTTRGMLKRAADTIEQLAAKLRAANMERSTAFYNGGWIPIKFRPMTEEEKKYYKEHTELEVEEIIESELPEDGQEVLITSNDYVSTDIFCKDDYYGSGFECADIENVKAWMPLPEPYKESEDK